jgi:thioredoxin reductase (NADPH)
VLVLSNEPKNSPLAKASTIENYPGLPQTSGLDLLEQMIGQASDLGVEFRFGRVISVLPIEGHFSVTKGDEAIEASSVILATGAQLAKPFVGEVEFLGRGVSYCATCDGMLYRNSTVCVVGMNSEALKEANFLTEIGATVVFLAKKSQELTGLSADIVVERGSVVEIKGDMMGVTGLVIKSEEAGEEKPIACQGIFILRPSIAPTALMAGLELNGAFICVDGALQTNIAGVFAAGDCIGKPLQVAKAVGEGQRACLSAIESLDSSFHEK